MVKIFKLTKEGKIPDFRVKNTGYWVDHDIRHIKDSFKWCLKTSPILFLIAAGLTSLYGIYNGWVLVNTIIFSVLTFNAIFLTVLFIRVLFFKGYYVGSVGKSHWWSNEVTQNTEFLPHNFDEKKLDRFEKDYKNIINIK